MGIQINGNTNNINAGIGSLSIEDLREIDIVGVATASNFKTGISNLHDVGLTLTGGQIDVGSNIKIGTAGVITATSFVGSGANLTGLPADITINSNADNRVITGSDTANTLNGESTLLFNNGRLDVTQTTSSSDAKVVVRNSNTPGSGSLRLEFQYGTGNIEGTNRYRFGYVEGYRQSGSNDGGLIFGTKPSNAAAPTERLRIKSNGYVGIGTNNPQRPLTLTSGTSGITAEFNIPDNSPTGSAGLSFNITDRSQSSTYAPLSFNATLYTFGNSGTERVRIDNNGILLLGHTSSPTSDADKLQVISTASGTGICLHNYSASAYGNQIAFMKSRSNTIGTNTVLNAYDRIGELNFYGNDGSGRSLGAQIQVRTDGTTTNDNTPAYFAFNTGTNQSMKTRLRISSSGVSCFSKTNASTGVVEPGNFILNVHTGAELNDGIKIVTNHNSGNQNSDSGKLMFCGEGQSNGVYIYKDNAIS